MSPVDVVAEGYMELAEDWDADHHATDVGSRVRAEVRDLRAFVEQLSSWPRADREGEAPSRKTRPGLPDFPHRSYAVSGDRQVAENDGCRCGHEQDAHGRVNSEPGTLGYGPCDHCHCTLFQEPT